MQVRRKRQNETPEPAIYDHLSPHPAVTVGDLQLILLRAWAPGYFHTPCFENVESWPA